MTPWMILGRWYDAKSRVQPEMFFSNAVVAFILLWSGTMSEQNDNNYTAPQMALLETQRYQDHLQSSILTTIYMALPFPK